MFESYAFLDFSHSVAQRGIFSGEVLLPRRVGTLIYRCVLPISFSPPSFGA